MGIKPAALRTLGGGSHTFELFRESLLPSSKLSCKSILSHTQCNIIQHNLAPWVKAERENEEVCERERLRKREGEGENERSN